MKMIISLINNPNLFSQRKSVDSFKWSICFDQIVYEQHITSGHRTLWDILQGVWYLAIDLCGVMVIIVGNGHGETSSNPGWDWLHFT